MTKADIKLVIITALGGALAIGIASLFNQSRTLLWRVVTLPVPLAIAVMLPVSIILPIWLVARNRKRRLTKLEQEFSEFRANAEKQETERKKRAALAQASLSVGRARAGGYNPNRW